MLGILPYNLLLHPRLPLLRSMTIGSSPLLGGLARMETYLLMGAPARRKEGQRKMPDLFVQLGRLTRPHVPSETLTSARTSLTGLGASIACGHGAATLPILWLEAETSVTYFWKCIWTTRFFADVMGAMFLPSS